MNWLHSLGIYSALIGKEREKKNPTHFLNLSKIFTFHNTQQLMCCPIPPVTTDFFFHFKDDCCI